MNEFAVEKSLKLPAFPELAQLLNSVKYSCRWILTEGKYWMSGRNIKWKQMRKI